MAVNSTQPLATEPRSHNLEELPTTVSLEEDSEPYTRLTAGLQPGEIPRREACWSVPRLTTYRTVRR